MNNYKLDKLVGRDPLPGDEVAFNRIARLFARARRVKVQQVSKKATTRKVASITSAPKTS